MLNNSFLSHTALLELQNKSAVNFEDLLQPITNAEAQVRIVLHEYDPELESKEWTVEEFAFNDTWLKGKRLQFRELLRKYNLLSKFSDYREEMEQMRTLSVETIKVLMDDLHSGRNSNNDNSYEKNNEKMIAMCMKQWKSDRNFTFLSNVKTRLRKGEWNMSDLQTAIRHYKLECVHSLQDINETTVDIEAPIEAAILISHPKYWPTCCQKEGEELLKDPAINTAIE